MWRSVGKLKVTFVATNFRDEKNKPRSLEGGSKKAILYIISARIYIYEASGKNVEGGKTLSLSPVAANRSFRPQD